MNPSGSARSQLVDRPQDHIRPRSQAIDLAAFELPSARPFLCDLHINHAHLGTVIEHVSNVEYVRWLDRVAELHADSLGYTRKWLLEQGIMWFVARHEIDYLAEVWLDDELVIATWVRDFKRVKSWRDYAIVRPRDGAVVCRAATLWVLVNLETRRPTRISQEMIDRFTQSNC
jgi:acyl-CoA thioester hydrolase